MSKKKFENKELVKKTGKNIYLLIGFKKEN